MNKKIPIILISFTTTSLHAGAVESREKPDITTVLQEPKAAPQMQQSDKIPTQHASNLTNVFVNVDQNQNAKNTAASTNVNSNTNTNTVVQYTFTYIKNVLRPLQNLRPRTWPGNIKAFIGTHKYKITVGTIVGSYATLCGKLIADNLYLKRSDLWSMWRRRQGGEYRSSPCVPLL